MTKTAVEHASVSKIPAVKNEKEQNEDSEPSESPPLVIKFLETLPPEKELTFMVEVVDRPIPPQTKIVVQNPGVSQLLVVQPKFKVPKVIAERSENVASVVKSEVKEDIEEEDEDDYGDEDEEDSLRIIEERVVDVRTLPGRINADCYAILMISGRATRSMTRLFFYISLSVIYTDTDFSCSLPRRVPLNAKARQKT